MPARPPVTAHVAEKQEHFHKATVDEVRSAVAAHDIVVVGMTVNPHVSRVCKALDEAGLEHHYIGYGGYHSKWKERLALKLWTGWPTFPQVFVNGQFIGGCDQTTHMLKSGELKLLLDAERS
ncbi:MAG: glutaredoxin [Proteobacteria bacterium]|nr:glutaredoxin [Pseudomonadota bacterium]